MVQRQHAIRRRRAGGLLLAVVVAVYAGNDTAAAQQAVAAATSLVFDSVTVIDVEQGKLLPGQRVVITGHRITAMGTAGTVKLPEHARVVEAQGKYLIPGLWDLHTHSEYSSRVYYRQFLANGVTGIRDAGSPVSLDTLRLWRREILAGTRIGPPRQILSAQSLSGSKSDCVRANELDGAESCVIDEMDSRRVINSFKAAGVDMIKLHSVATAELYYALAAEARRVGIPFGGHVEAAVTAAEASDSSALILDHLSAGGGIDSLCLGLGMGASYVSLAACQMVADHLRKHGTWFVPTRVIYGMFDAQVGMRSGYTGRRSQPMLDANPLADITNTTTVCAVVANGRYFDRAALDTLLAEGRVER